MFRLGISVAVFATLPLILKISWLMSFLVALIAYILSGGWKNIQILIHCIPRDAKYLLCVVKIVRFRKTVMTTKIMLYDYLLEHSQKSPNKAAYIAAESGDQLTYKEAYELANRIANYFYDKGYREGDVIAFMMENRIEYVPIWLGLSKLGVVTSLININLKGKSLQHCIEIVNSKGLIYTPKMADAIKTIELNSTEPFLWDNSFAQVLRCVSDSEPPLNARDDKPMLYIYTSGTTGLPKAVIVKSYKCTQAGPGFSGIIGAKKTDICYNALPLYHSNAGLAVTTACLYLGTTLVIRKKFSASNFFKDCCKYNCTFFNYIGEICRYLLAQPPQEFDRKHKLRFATGNGLRKSIWKEFQERFNVQTMVEFFGATEGNFMFTNINGHVGSVGFLPLILKPLKVIALMKVNEFTGQLERGVDGLGIPVKLGEPGMLVSKIDEKRGSEFNGYTDKEASKKKVEYDVIVKGDKVFVFGDMLYADEYGYYYFTDRLGDTFRWKGENVSTNEVEGVISKSVQLNDVCVYGVEINGIEGKAGMACIVDPQRKLDLKLFSSLIGEALASYARPIFLRLCDEVNVTGTFKFQKADLRKEGFDPMKCGNDHLFYFDLKTKSYITLDEKVYDEIQSAMIRF